MFMIPGCIDIHYPWFPHSLIVNIPSSNDRTMNGSDGNVNKKNLPQKKSSWNMADDVWFPRKAE